MNTLKNWFSGSNPTVVDGTQTLNKRSKSATNLLLEQQRQEQMNEMEDVPPKTTMMTKCDPVPLELHYRWWLPSPTTTAHNTHHKVRAIVLIIHGYGEHVGVYEELGTTLNRENIAMFGFDLRGFGQSQGTRRQLDNFDQYFSDIECAIDQIHLQFPQNEHPDLKLFLWGMGAGGIVVTSFAIKGNEPYRSRVNGVILVGPGFELGDNMKSPLKVTLLDGIAYFLPWISVQHLDKNNISSDPAYTERLDKDQWIDLGGMPAWYASVFVSEQRWLRDNISSFNVPVLLQHGECDLLADPSGSKWMIEKCSSEDKTLKLYMNMYHNLYHEFSSEHVTDDLLKWLRRRW